MKLVTVYDGKITSEKEIVNLTGLSNESVVKGFKAKGFKNQKSLRVRACSSVKFINEFLNATKTTKSINYSNKMSFDDYVSDFFDLHIALLSGSELAKYLKSYNGE